MKTHLYLFFVVTVSSVQSATIWNLAMGEWDLFKLEHGKHYNHLEEKFRMLLFIDRKHKINKHNFKYEKGLVSYKLAVNKYADKYHHEFVDKLYGYNSTLALKFRENNVNLRGKLNSRANVELPESVNWVEKGAVTRVKDQGNCGSCWAFSSTGSLEGQYFHRTGKLISLSEQNLMDCTYDYDNHGCEGGLMDNAFDYIKDNGGIDNEQNYPYEEEVGPCRYKSEYHEAEDVGLVDIEQGNEEELKFAVATIGPISVAIDASHDSFLYYSKGIYHEPDCSEFDLVHAVLVVGYGTDENGMDYWLVKNSWGEHWGDKGYIKMRRNSNNHCGIATLASYPLV